MERFAFSLFAILFLAAGSAAAQTQVSGQVTSDGEPVPFANVGVQGTTLGSAANAEGEFQINVPSPGSYTIVASAVGFETVSQSIDVGEGRQVLDFELEERVFQTDGVVVTGTLKETFVKDSPVKVDVVSGRFLEKIPTANVMEVIENVNGLTQQVDCGACFPNSISINGMEGPYTAVLIDGMPLMNALATVYGLNGISPSIIQQIEVVKGPVSTLYGTEAMAGVVNVITKRPEYAPRLSLNTFGTSDQEFSAEGAFGHRFGRFATLVSGSVFHNDHFVDENSDGFADMTHDTRVSLFGKGTLQNRDGFKVMNLSARYYGETRLAGTELFLDQYSEALRGSNEIYGESVETRRFEAMGAYHLLPKRGLRLDAAYNWHDQDSFYGPDSYAAQQHVGFGQLVWDHRLSRSHDLLVGAALRYQAYDDNAGSTGDYDEAGNLLENQPDRRLIPGIFVQDEYVASESVRLLGGLRLDHHAEHGFIFSPRASAKVGPHPNTTLRVNAGTGFRVVNLFTEDHLAYHGARAAVILEDLDPERSYSTTASLQQIVPFGANPLTIDVDGFYTYFTNKIEPDYTVPGEIRYANLDGRSISRGVSVTLTHRFSALPLTYSAGTTIMDVFTETGGTRRALEFAPDYTGTASVTYDLPRWDVAFDYTARLTGPMRLPEYDAETAAAYASATGHPLRHISPVFMLHNLQVSKDFPLATGGDVQVYVAVENLFDYTQPSPLVGYYEGNPGFGETFDTTYVYGPVHGRCMGLGVRVNMR